MEHQKIARRVFMAHTVKTDDFSHDENRTRCGCRLEGWVFVAAKTGKKDRKCREVVM